MLFGSGYATTILWLLIPFCYSALKSSPIGSSVSWRVLSLQRILILYIYIFLFFIFILSIFYCFPMFFNGSLPAPGVYHTLAFLILWRRAQPRQFEGAAPEDDTKGELRRNFAVVNGKCFMDSSCICDFFFGRKRWIKLKKTGSIVTIVRL